MSFWEPCWACRVIENRSLAVVVAETSDVVVALNPFPLAPGHALVMPRRHIENVFELPDELAGPVLSVAGRVARAAKRAFGCDGITLRQNNGAASDQHLFHFHLHVIPRFAGDESRFATTPLQADDAELHRTGVILRSAMSGMA